MDEFNPHQLMHGVPESRLQRCYQYKSMCGAEDEIRGAKAIALRGAPSQSRSMCAQTEI